MPLSISQIDRHPTARLIAVNGLMINARQAFCEVQVEAFDRGFIPYLPEDNDL